MLNQRIIIGLVVAGMIASGDIVQASDPVGDFFKRVGNSIAKAGKQPAVRRTGSKTSTKQTGAKNANAPTEPGQPTGSASPDAATASPTPSPLLARRASAAPANKDIKRDAPYGIPVPGKEGFVTSPFAPDAGMVDVRDFPKGTEVKDPYTGKIFLRP